jgi:hypothetical protein
MDALVAGIANPPLRAAAKMHMERAGSLLPRKRRRRISERQNSKFAS